MKTFKRLIILVLVAIVAFVGYGQWEIYRDTPPPGGGIKAPDYDPGPQDEK